MEVIVCSTQHALCSESTPHKQALSAFYLDEDPAAILWKLTSTVQYAKPEALMLSFPEEYVLFKNTRLGLPWWYNGRESTCQCREHGFEPRSGKIPYTTKPMHHNYLSLGVATTEACEPRACAPQQEKPPQREAYAPQ